MLKEYEAIKKKQFRLMDDQGNIILKKHMPELSDDELIEAYKNMLFARTADLMIVSYQRQGRIFTYPPNYGQEAISGALAGVMKTDDWLVPAFREMGAWLAKGVELKEIFMYFMGYESGTVFKKAKNILPISVPIASQLPHATGIGYALKHKQSPDVVYAFVGDGGTSQGDFHEALNFAAVWKVPVVFIVQNNQFAISVPFKTQTASDGIAIKSIAYGMPGIQVDGNDYFALRKCFEDSADFVRSGNGPILIEAVTYRKGAHTTSDDPSKYRSKDEEDEWDLKDPLRRLRLHLEARELWNEELEEKLVQQYKKEVDRIFTEAEIQPSYPLDEVFSYHYENLPDELLQQKADHQKYLNWQTENN